jgi:hypothetical protein
MTRAEILWAILIVILIECTRLLLAARAVYC